MVLGSTSGVAYDDHAVAYLQTVMRDTLAAQVPAGAPLDGPALHRAFFVRPLHRQEGMRIPEEKLHHFALHLLGLIFQIGGCKRVVGVSPAIGNHRDGHPAPIQVRDIAAQRL